jgi:hypothetical protein
VVSFLYMVDIRFEGDSAPVRPNLKSRESRLTRFLIAKSFGLIKTPQQAAIAQLVLAGGLFIIAGILLNSASDSTTLVSPSSELINARQPVGPLR